MIRFNCHRCGMLMQAADAGAGRSAKCPGCGMIVKIPKAPAVVTPPPAPPPAPVPLPPAVSATLRQSAMPVPAGGMAPPSPLSRDELPGDGSPLRRSPGGVDDPLEPPSPLGTGSHTADHYGVIRGRREQPGLSNAALRNLGIAALGVGGLGIALFWLQFAGPIVAFIGFAAGLIALFVGASRGDAPMGLGYAGAGLSFVGVVLGSYWTYSLLTKPGEAQIAAAKTQDGADEATAGRAKLVPVAVTARFAEGAALGAAGGDTLDDRDPLKFASGAYRQVESFGSKNIVASTRDRRPKAAAPRLIFDGDGNAVAVTAAPDDRSSDSASAADQTPAAKDAAAPPPIKWADAEKHEPQGSGSLQVTITSVITGKVPTYAIGGLPTLVNLTESPAMTIWLKIRNTDVAGSADYLGWMGAKADSAKIGSELIDDHGRKHPQLRHLIKPDEAIQGSMQGDGPLKPILAGQSVADAILFPMPPADADSFELTLSGKAIGQEEDLHFRIPKSMIKPDESNPLLGGLGN